MARGEEDLKVYLYHTQTLVLVGTDGQRQALTTLPQKTQPIS